MMIKNSIFENDIMEFILSIDIEKIKSSLDKKGKRKYHYNILWNIKAKEFDKYDNDILLSASYESVNENEFKIIIRSLIVGLLMIGKRCKLILGIDEKIRKLIKEFTEKLNNRKKIDNDYYIELLFIEKILKDNDIEIKEYRKGEFEIIEEVKKKARLILEGEAKEKKLHGKIDIIDNALLINEYNLIWNKSIISGGFRKWRKKASDAIWKNEILNSEKLNDLFMYNFKKEFDWQTTLEFISNRTSFSKRQCCDADTRDRSYRIKNLLKDLPTYKVLYQRNLEMIKSTVCRRCKKDEESWDHIWICEDNESTIKEIAEESMHKYEMLLEEKDKTEEIKILRNFNVDFIKILLQPSLILLGKNRIWELLRGVFNDNFNRLTKKKEEKDVIKGLWNFIYEEFRTRIWLSRCDEVARLEKEDDIQKQDLKRKRKKELEDEEEEKIENQKTNKNIKKEKNNINKKFKRNISLVTQNRMIGHLTEGGSKGLTWDMFPKLL